MPWAGRREDSLTLESKAEVTCKSGAKIKMKFGAEFQRFLLLLFFWMEYPASLVQMFNEYFMTGLGTEY